MTDKKKVSSKSITYKDRRKSAYGKAIPIGDQLDAILKAFDYVLDSGGDLPYELVDVIEKWHNIKEKYPKRTKGNK